MAGRAPVEPPAAAADHRRPVTEYPKVALKPKEEGRLQGGHLWAFSNEIAHSPANAEAGMLADLYHADKGFLGRGFYHPRSLIAFRIVSHQKDELIDGAFLKKRLQDALDSRQFLYPGQTAYRWVFGESDRLPGVVIDRYGDYVVVQIIAAGMERLKDSIIAALQEIAQPKGIILRSDSSLRELEGLPKNEAVIAAGELPARVEIETENGRFGVDLLSGQKTGFYFDQRDNRQALAAFCKGRKVLDGFCYSGAFGIAAGRAGAREIVFADTASAALELASENAERNALEARLTFVEGDVQKLLEHDAPGGPFEVIAIDPPAFARSKKFLPAAQKAYEKLNAVAMSALPRGGILATSSCSQHLTRELFLEMLRRAARRAHRNFRLLELRSQAKDHPVLLAMPETEYLKFAILQVL
jgi:23S rRNA (cytosine1962-C5)-methyltransferase